MNRGYKSHSRIISRRTPEDFTPDGNLAKPAWREARWARFDDDPFRRKRHIRAQTAVATLWTPRTLYLGYRCRYVVLNVFHGENPTKEKMGLWNRDVVEAFLNPQPRHMDHYYEFEVAPNNLWIDLEINLQKNPTYDARWNSGFEHATTINRARRFWTCEMRIPVASLGVQALREGMAWRGNFYRATGFGDDAHRSFLCWSPVHGLRKPNFHVPEFFGLIDFA